MTGIHLMRTGEVVANIAVLNDQFRLSAIDELVARKRGGAEKMPLDDRDQALHGPLLDRLEAELAEAHDRSALPDEPVTARELDAFVIRLRLETVRAETS